MDDEKADAMKSEEKLAYDSWAAKKKTDAWKVGAARAMRAWPLGKEVTESEYDQAVYDACNSPIR
jgi:hypothetical protein